MPRKLFVLTGMLVVLVGCSGKTDKELCAEGIRALQEGNSGGAIVLLKSALEKNQNNLEARHQLAKAYMASGKYEQSEKEFQKVERQNPSRPDIKLELARLYNLMKKPESAIRKAEEYLAVNPEAPDALEAVGTAYVSRNMPTEAETYFLKALQNEPDRTSAKLELATLYHSQNKTEQARTLLNEVLIADQANSRANYLLAGIELAQGNRDKALAIYTKVAELHGNDPEAPYRSALMRLEAGDAAEATKTADMLIRKFPERAEGYRLKGIILNSQKIFPEAIAFLQNSLKLQPTMSAHYYLGLSLYNHGELENALSQFRIILDRAPSFHPARLLVGIILLKQNRIDDAVAEIGKVVKTDPQNAAARNLLGSAYMAKGLYEDGMKELELATKLEPRLVDAYLKKGIFHLSRGNAGEVEAEFRAAVQVAPELLSTRLILSSYYMQRRNSGKALAVLHEGLTGKKSDAALYSAMAKIMFATRKSSVGLQYLDKAEEKDPTATGPHFMAAAYYTGAGEFEKALREYGVITNKEPKNVKALLRIAALLEISGHPGEAMNWYLKAKDTGSSEAYMALTDYLVRANRAPQALSILDEARKRFPREAAFLERKGRLHVRDRQYKDALKVSNDLESLENERGIALRVDTLLAMNNKEEALKEARRLTTLKPDSSAGYMLVATVCRAQKDNVRAIEALQKGLKVGGKDPAAALMLANAYAASGNASLAMQTCNDIILSHPDYAPAYFVQGTILQTSGKPKEAVGKYLATLSFAESNVPALNNLAYLYAEGHGSAEDAVRLAGIALALDPGNPVVLDTLGFSYLKCGRVQEARQTLEKAAALLQGNPTVSYHLALACKKSGEKTKAVALLRQALSAGDFTEARQAQSLLSELN